MDNYMEGYAHTHIADYHKPGLFRRASDRATAAPRPVIESNSTPPVTIFTLGRFSLLVNGQPADFGRKFPKRPLELLKTIIAQGGREISISRLTMLIWPDVDGDKATRSFDTTLHRLRKILNHDRVLVLRDGKLSLDARYCWVDVWAFERLLGEARRILRSTADSNQISLLEGLTENLLALYQDHFLIREDVTGWSVSMRERLRHKFIHHLIEIGRFCETHGYWEQAIECYQKGIDVDDLVEVFYQRLMSCYLNTNRLSEGMLIYRRCCETLSIMLSLQPEPETESLYQALRNTRLGKKSA
jgi:two-component SAPR family response regulator